MSEQLESISELAEGKKMYYERLENISAWRGCNYNCVYCAFRNTLSRSGCEECKKYTPHAHLEVLEREPKRTSDYGFITLSMNGELAFAPDDVIQKHLDYATKYSDRNFVLHTKNPARFKTFNIPSNIVLITTIESDKIANYDAISKAPPVEERIAAMKDLKCRKAVTIEPIIDFNYDIFLKHLKDIKPEYIYIGYNSKKSVKLNEPTLDKTKRFIEKLRLFTKVKEKLMRKGIEVLSEPGLLTISDVLQQKNAIQILIDFKWTDNGNSERLVLLHGENIRYNHTANKWLIWNGRYWEIDNIDKIVVTAIEVIRGLYPIANEIKDDEKRKKFTSFLLKCESAGKINSMISLTKSKCPILTENLDINKMLLNVQNGTIDLTTGILRKALKEDYITKTSPVIYNKDAKCPKWEAFLDTIFQNNKNIISYIKRAIGYSLTGLAGEQCMFILYGTGKNGKSTLLNVVSFIIGEYGMNTPASTFLSKKYDSGSTNDLARLKDRRFVCCMEPEGGAHLAESVVKQATGSDKITARFLFQEFFEFEPQWKIFMATNHKPEIKGQNEGIWRRIHLIPFNYKFNDDERILNYDQILINEESSGILNWALEGCLEWQKDGLGMPDEVKAAVKEYKDEMDVLGEFLDITCIKDGSSDIENIQLHKLHTIYCKCINQHIWSMKYFSNKMKERGEQGIRKSQGNIWFGYKLKPIYQLVLCEENEKDMINKMNEILYGGLNIEEIGKDGWECRTDLK